ncbi:MAG: hypothetical protein H0V22_10490 [Solirubrobacterales bacterium]|nr:hypothetical protein [Solirubrobacterales bacterium]
MGRSRRASLAAIAVLGTFTATVDASLPSRAAVSGQRANADPGVVLDHGTKVFTGSGRTSLGLIRLRRKATLTWRHSSGGRLQITTGKTRPFLLLSTTQAQGSIALRRGTYRAVRVITSGGWRIQLRTSK